MIPSQQPILRGESSQSTSFRQWQMGEEQAEDGDRKQAEVGG